MISIVIPALQEEKFIADTVGQFRELSIPHEIIVADGKSSDRTVEEAQRAGARVVISHGVRRPSRQRNEGGRAATGDIILFIDSSVRLPDIDAFIRKALAHFEDPHVVGLALPQRIYPEAETVTDRFILVVTNWMLHLQKLGSGKFILVRRRAFERIGGFREDLVAGEDHDIFRRLKTVGTVHFDRHLVALYSGRREHTIGWLRVLWIWTLDGIWVTLFDRSFSTEWRQGR